MISEALFASFSVVAEDRTFGKILTLLTYYHYSCVRVLCRSSGIFWEKRRNGFFVRMANGNRESCRFV